MCTRDRSGSVRRGSLRVVPCYVLALNLFHRQAFSQFGPNPIFRTRSLEHAYRPMTALTACDEMASGRQLPRKDRTSVRTVTNCFTRPADRQFVAGFPFPN
jgi:hypothetical protein